MKPFIQKLWILIAMLCVSISASAYDFEVDGIRYDITSFTELTATASSLSSDVTGELSIPSIVKFNSKDLRVNNIGPNFASSNTSITSLIIASTINVIGDYAFSGCESLQSIDIAGAEQIGQYAFESCKNLTNVKLSDTLISIGAYAFMYNEALESIVIPSSVLSLGKGVFKNCRSLGVVELPANLTIIPNNAFENCTSLCSISLSNQLESIGSQAFKNTAFKYFVIPNSVRNIDANVFDYCAALEEVSIGNNITFLPQCFTGCDNLRKMRFEDGTLAITMAPGKELYEKYQYANNIIYAYKGYFSDTKVDTVYLGRNFLNYKYSPDPYTDYHSGPFLSANNLKTIELGSGVTNIPGRRFVDNFYGAFENCLNLSSVSLGSNVGTISENCFKNCKALLNISLPHNLVLIPNGCFDGCASLSAITFGYNLASIGSNAFNGCSSLSKLSFYGLNAPAYSGGFSNTQYLYANVYVPIGYKDSYDSTSPWSNFWNITEDSNMLAYFTLNGVRYEVLPNNRVKVIGTELETLSDIVLAETVTYNERDFTLSEICQGAFADNKKINSIVFPDNLSSLPNEVLRGCSNLTSIRLPNCLAHISDGAFLGCTNLQDVSIPRTITSFGNSCFSYCSSLQTVDIGSNDMSIISQEAFFNCTSLERIILPQSLTNISDKAFYGCRNLESVQLNNVISIGEEAFNGCSKISEMVIPSSCTNISNGAFNGMTALKNIEIESGKPLKLGHNMKVNLSSSITPYPNPSDVDERRTGFRNGYYDGLFYGLPIEHLVINRDIELPNYYERTMGSPTSNYSTVYNDIIYYPPFYGLTNLKSVEIGENVSAICKNQIEAVVNAVPTTMEYTNFGKCDNIEVVVSNNPNAPIGGGFSQSVYKNATLFLPNGGEDSYLNDDYWKNFSHISDSPFVAIESISFGSEELEIDLNESEPLLPTITPADASINKLRWASSVPSIVSVSEDGIITSSTREGEALITATAADGSGEFATIKVSVVNGTGVNDIIADGKINIQVENGKIFVDGKGDSDVVQVYNVQGQRLISTTKNVIGVNANGIHLVKIGSYVKKIVI